MSMTRSMVPRSRRFASSSQYQGPTYWPQRHRTPSCRPVRPTPPEILLALIKTGIRIIMALSHKVGDRRRSIGRPGFVLRPPAAFNEGQYARLGVADGQLWSCDDVEWGSRGTIVWHPDKRWGGRSFCHRPGPAASVPSPVRRGTFRLGPSVSPFTHDLVLLSNVFSFLANK